MLICPVCSSSNPNGSISCERCNSAFERIDQTLAAELGKQDLGGQDTSALPKVSLGGLNPSRSEFSLGDVIAGRYRVVRQLGQGGMGTVY